jgi:hypothetical protein
VRGRTLTVRAIGLLGAGAVAVHQLRYAIAYGNAAPDALAAHNHSYFGLALPTVATVFVIALSAMLIRLAHGRAATPGRRTPFALLWLCCALTLGAIYGIQETLEGAGALAGGGWIGFALAFPAGLLVAVAIRGSDSAAIALDPVLPRIRAVVLAAPGIHPVAVPRRVLDLRLGARAPPPAFVV